MAKCIMELERIYGIRQGSANEKGTIIGDGNISEMFKCRPKYFGVLKTL